MASLDQAACRHVIMGMSCTRPASANSGFQATELMCDSIQSCKPYADSEQALHTSGDLQSAHRTYWACAVYQHTGSCWRRWQADQGLTLGCCLTRNTPRATERRRLDSALHPGVLAVHRIMLPMHNETCQLPVFQLMQCSAGCGS